MRQRPAVTVTTIVILLLLPLAAGCKHAGADDESLVKVTNGVETSDYPWVVELDSPSEGWVCSGTFVSDTTALTAAHCIDGSATSGLQFAGKSPVKVFWTGAFGHTAAPKATDLAILVFPAGSAPATTQIAAAAPVTGDPVTLVGYGQNDVNNTGSLGVKRQGTNVVAGLAVGFIHLIGLPAATDGVAPGAQAASAPGDSGGPLFLRAMIAGVDTGGGVHADGKKHSYYVDLSSTQSCAMLNTAIAGGAVIDPLPTACRAQAAPTSTGTQTSVPPPTSTATPTSVPPPPTSTDTQTPSLSQPTSTDTQSPDPTASPN